MAESSCDEWEAISEMLIKEGDEAAGFLVLHDKPTEELNEELKGKMTDLQETIKRLSEPGLSGHTDEPNIDMETKEGSPRICASVVPAGYFPDAFSKLVVFPESFPSIPDSSWTCSSLSLRRS